MTDEKHGLSHAKISNSTAAELRLSTFFCKVNVFFLVKPAALWHSKSIIEKYCYGDFVKTSLDIVLIGLDILRSKLIG